MAQVMLSRSRPWPLLKEGELVFNSPSRRDGMSPFLEKAEQVGAFNMLESVGGKQYFLC